MAITKAQLRTLRTEMQAALDKAGIADFEFEVGNMRFCTDEVDIKVKGKLAGVTTTTDRLFQQKVAEHGLKLTGLKGETLTGYTARLKYPFSYTTVRGARYKCSAQQAKAIFV
jgi:hypothetical protein